MVVFRISADSARCDIDVCEKEIEIKERSAGGVLLFCKPHVLSMSTFSVPKSSPHVYKGHAFLVDTIADTGVIAC